MGNERENVWLILIHRVFLCVVEAVGAAENCKLESGKAQDMREAFTFIAFFLGEVEAGRNSVLRRAEVERSEKFCCLCWLRSENQFVASTSLFVLIRVGESKSEEKKC